MGTANFIIYQLIMVCIYGIMAIGLNFQYGFAGLLNFGYVAFFCTGAYASALVVKAGAPFLIGVITAAGSAGFLGFLISIPTARLSVHYWAIVTLAAGEIVRLIVNNEEWLTNGSFGIPGIPQPLSSVIPKDVYPLFYLFLCILFLGIIYFISHILVKSPFGRVIKAIREGDELPLAMGKNVFQYKIKVLALGAAFAGVAGALYAHYLTYISPLNFMPLVTFIVWAMVIVGGRGNNLGVLTGTLIIIFIFNSSRFIKDVIPLSTNVIGSLRMVVIGVFLILILMFRHEGLIRETKRVYK